MAATYLSLFLAVAVLAAAGLVCVALLKLERIGQSVRDLEERLSRFDRETRQQTGERLERLEGRVEGTRTALGRFEGRVDRLAGGVEDARAALGRFEGRLDKLGGGLKEMGGAVREHVSAIFSKVDVHQSANSKQISRFETQLDKLSADLGTLGERVRDNAETLGRLISRFETQQGKLAADHAALAKAVRETADTVIPNCNEGGDLESLKIVGQTAAKLAARLARDKSPAQHAVARRAYTIQARDKSLSFELIGLPYFHHYNVFKKLDITGDWNKSFRQLSDEIVNSKTSYLLHDRLYMLWQAVKNVSHSSSPIVEVGVWRGGSTRFLAEAQRFFGKRGAIFSCDTFSGHPEVAAGIDGEHQAGGFANVDYEEVKKFLSPYPEVEIVHGSIEETAFRVDAPAISLVHLDTDLYSPTKFVLEYFAPRLEPDGIVVVDDYGFTTCPGVRQAVDEFLTANSAFQSFHVSTGQVLVLRGGASTTASATAPISTQDH